MKIERSVWFGEVGMRTAVTRRLTVFFVPTVVVVFFSTTVTCNDPQRSTSATDPEIVFVVVVTFSFGVAAIALATGVASARVSMVAVTAFFMDLSFLRGRS